jgi:hypothetical protein
MSVLINKIKNAKRLVRLSIIAIAIVFFIISRLSAQEIDPTNAEKNEAIKIDKQIGMGGKLTGTQFDIAQQRNWESGMLFTASTANDEDMMAAKRSIDILNNMIKNVEASGLQVDDLKARAAALSTSLSSRDKSSLQILTEAFAATLEAVGQLQHLVPERPPEPKPQFPLFISVLALAAAVLALAIVPFFARAAVTKTLRKAGLI